MSRSFPAASAGVDWKGNGIRNRGTGTLRVTLTGDIELDLGVSSGLSEKSFAIPPHLEACSLLTDFVEPEPELLLFDWKTPIDIVLLALFSTKASKLVGPTVAVFSRAGFDDLDPVVVSSGLSGIVSWTIPRSSESRPESEAFLRCEDRDFILPEPVIIAPILSLLSSSTGVGIVE